MKPEMEITEINECNVSGRTVVNQVITRNREANLTASAQNVVVTDEFGKRLVSMREDVFLNLASAAN